MGALLRYVMLSGWDRMFMLFGLKLLGCVCYQVGIGWEHCYVMLCHDNMSCNVMLCKDA